MISVTSMLAYVLRVLLLGVVHRSKCVLSSWCWGVCDQNDNMYIIINICHQKCLGVCLVVGAGAFVIGVMYVVFSWYFVFEMCILFQRDGVGVVRTKMYLDAHMHTTCVHIHTYTHHMIHPCTHHMRTCTHSYTHTHIHTYTNTDIQTYAPTDTTCANIHTSHDAHMHLPHTHIYTHAHTYTHTHMHTPHAHTYIHTYIT